MKFAIFHRTGFPSKQLDSCDFDFAQSMSCSRHLGAKEIPQPGTARTRSESGTLGREMGGLLFDGSRFGVVKTRIPMETM